MKRAFAYVVLVLVVGALGPWWTPEAEAIPAFARKYGVACSLCHAVYPKLTTIGRAFDENGFRMRNDTSTLRDTVSSIPGAFRGTLFTSGIGPDTDASTFGLLKPIAAGSLGSWVSFWAVRSYFADEDDVDDIGSTDVWVRVDDVLRSLKPGVLNVKAGKFELDLPFTQARSYNLFAYEAYFVRTGDEGFALGEPERGFELSGEPGKGLRYSLAVVEGVNETPGHEDDFDADLYFRLSWTAEALHRFGLFAYRGSNTLVSSGVEERVDDLTRVGGDFDFRPSRGDVNLYGLYLWGRNSNSVLDPVDPERSFDGGFVQLDYRLASFVTLVSRYDIVRPEEISETSATPMTVTRQSFALGAQSWFFDRLKIAFEYRFRDEGLSDSGALTFDFVL